MPVRPGVGRCEVVCFTSDHNSSFGALPPARVRTVLDALADRTAEMSALPGVAQVFPFENRGVEIGVTLHHPHGQIYAYPFVPPRTRAMLAAAAPARRAHRRRNLYADVLAAERAAGVRVVAANEHWTAYVPAAARWPFEVHLAPHRQVPDIPALDDAERDAFGPLYLDVLRRFDALFDQPMPYISAWHQASVRRGPRAGLPAPAAVQHPAGGGQAEVPGRLGVGDGRLHQRHRPRKRPPSNSAQAAWRLGGGGPGTRPPAGKGRQAANAPTGRATS